MKLYFKIFFWRGLEGPKRGLGQEFGSAETGLPTKNEIVKTT